MRDVACTGLNNVAPVRSIKRYTSFCNDLDGNATSFSSLSFHRTVSTWTDWIVRMRHCGDDNNKNHAIDTTGTTVSSDDAS